MVHNKRHVRFRYSALHNYRQVNQSTLSLCFSLPVGSLQLWIAVRIPTKIFHNRPDIILTIRVDKLIKFCLLC